MRTRNILILLIILLAVGGVYFYSSRPKLTEPEEPRWYAWEIEMEEIAHIEIELPGEGMSQAFIKIPEGDKFPWYFDDPERSDISQVRWGGGVPLLLSGPGVDRIISQNTTEERIKHNTSSFNVRGWVLNTEFKNGT